MVAPSLAPVVARLSASHEVVHIHTPLPEAALVAALCRARRRPLLMTHQGDLVMPAGLGNQIVQKAGDAMLTLAARLATKVTTNSHDYAEHSNFLRPHAAKTVPIYPPVDVERPDLDSVHRWRHELGLGSKRLVGFAGRFVEEKGFDYLLRALPELVSADPDVHLIYAGEHRVAYESFYERCRPLVEAAGDRLTFVGLLRDRQRLANFFAMCDVVALPSRTDCFAAVQLEAMLCGTPVVAADIPGAREAVTLTGMGVLVHPRDPGALARGVLDALRDREQLVKSREQVRAVFDPTLSITRYESLFAELVDVGS